MKMKSVHAALVGLAIAVVTLFGTAGTAQADFPLTQMTEQYTTSDVDLEVFVKSYVSDNYGDSLLWLFQGDIFDDKVDVYVALQYDNRPTMFVTPQFPVGTAPFTITSQYSIANEDFLIQESGAVWWYDRMDWPLNDPNWIMLGIDVDQDGVPDASYRLDL